MSAVALRDSPLDMEAARDTWSATAAPALLTDLYQLTMAAGYHRLGVAHTEAVFYLSFRDHPFDGGFTVACGLADAVRYVESFCFTHDDVAYLASLRAGDGTPLFDGDLLELLRTLRPAVDIDAVPEGTVVFPREPILRVRGPVLDCQLIETALLNLVNFQTLIATKAARVCLAADGDDVLEFGLRRAQGIDGAVSASRAAYVGGCAATSNVLAGRVHGIPVRGTHAHSWVMLFGDELVAFEKYADAMPHNCLLLVDTYDTHEGIRHAIAVGKRLRERGHDLLGVRLDSGDVAALSIDARRMLDEAGFDGAIIVASNDLDEHAIAALKRRGAKVDAWGVGTRLVTGWGDPALGGVYKLSSVRAPGGAWEPRMKLSEHPAKMSDPGTLQVRRFKRADGSFAADAIYDVAAGEVADGRAWRLVGQAPDGSSDSDGQEQMEIARDHDGALACEDLLVPVVRGGRRRMELPPLAEVRAYARAQIDRLAPGVKRLVAPERYFVGLEQSLHERRARLIEGARATVLPR